MQETTAAAPTVRIIDLSARAPAKYRLRKRAASDVKSIVLHQTAFSGWKPNNPMWAKVRAHYVVRQDGSVLLLHLPTVRMRYGSGRCNAQCVTIEHEGNLPSARGSWWKPERYGRDQLADHPAQVRAARELLRMLHREYPSIERIVAHRHISKLKANCPGPDLWREIGEWSIDELGLVEAKPLSTGSTLPPSWRGKPKIR
jgi:N-acetyl-anhydromuramyl-L-alanine amidase AmpD